MSFSVGETLRIRTIQSYEGGLVEDYYTVTGELTLQELLNFNVSAYAQIYKTYYTREEYSLISRSATVYTLTNKASVSFTVPSTVIEEVIEDAMVTYESKTLAISLGEHPQYREFTALSEYLKDAVSEYIGVTPVVTLITTSDPIRVSEECHIYLTELRERISATIKTPYRRLIQRETELEFLQQENVGLRRFIQEYLETCATDCNPDAVTDPDDPTSNTLIDKAAFNFEISSRNYMRNPCYSNGQ